MKKQMVKERMVLRDGAIKEISHEVELIEHAYPTTLDCPDCRRVVSTGLIRPFQIVCWECCYGLTPCFDSQTDLIAWIGVS